MVGASSSDSTALGAAVLIYLAVIVLFFVGWWKIVSKAGYSGWLSLLGLVPLVNVVMFLVFAFSDWPVRRELRAARGAHLPSGSFGEYPGAAPPPPPPPPA